MKDEALNLCTRRRLLRYGGAAVAGAACLGSNPFPAIAAKPKREAAEEEISPVEDLMREHGVVERIIVIYDEIATRIEGGQPSPADVLSDSAHIIRRFIEDYHEQNEEKYLFPRFLQAHQLTDLVNTLFAQHQAGRELTGRILDPGTPAAEVARCLRRFNRMYLPHASRETTILFPAFHTMVSRREYARLGDEFEAVEHRLFGEGGFEQIVAQVGRLEQRLGIGDLGYFTPRP